MDTYAVGDAVALDGSSYIALSANAGVQPGTDESKWALLARGGINGADGTDGIDGSNGSNGWNGSNGAQGAQGAQGPQGLQGPAGVNGTNGTNGTNGIDGAEGPQGPQGPAGAVTGTLAGLGVGRVMAWAAPGAAPLRQPMLSTQPSSSIEFVAVTLDVTSERPVPSLGYWAGYVECSFDGGATESSTSRSPVVFMDANAMSPGSEMYVTAQIAPTAASTLSCMVIQTSGGGNLPTISVVVQSAMGLSVDYSTPDFSNFSDQTGVAP